MRLLLQNLRRRACWLWGHDFWFDGGDNEEYEHLFITDQPLRCRWCYDYAEQPRPSLWARDRLEQAYYRWMQWLPEPVFRLGQRLGLPFPDYWHMGRAWVGSWTLEGPRETVS